MTTQVYKATITQGQNSSTSYSLWFDTPRGQAKVSLSKGEEAVEYIWNPLFSRATPAISTAGVINWVTLKDIVQGLVVSIRMMADGPPPKHMKGFHYAFSILPPGSPGDTPIGPTDCWLVDDKTKSLVLPRAESETLPRLDDERDKHTFVVETDYQYRHGTRCTEFGQGTFEYPQKAMCKERYDSFKPEDGDGLRALMVCRIVHALRLSGKGMNLGDIAAAIGASSPQRVSGLVLHLVSRNILAPDGPLYVEGGSAEDMIKANLDGAVVGRTITRLWGECS